MRKPVFILLLFFNSFVFSQNNLGMILNQIIYIPFSYDTCNCISKTATQYKYNLFGKQQINYINKFKYQDGNRIGANGEKYVYDSIDNKNLIDWLSIASKTSERFDTILVSKYRAKDTINKSEWIKARSLNFIKYYTVKQGYVTKIETKYEKFNHISFFEYDSNKRIVKFYERDTFKLSKKILTGESVYDSNENVSMEIDYTYNDGIIDTAWLIERFFDENDKLIKEQTSGYGNLYQTILFEYNDQGLESKEIYFDGNNKWDGSYETIYNEKNQIKAVYQLNKKGKRKRLLASYVYEY